MAYPAKSERNRALFTAYRRGATAEQLAGQFGISTYSVRTLLYRHKVTLPLYERRRRALAARKSASYCKVGPRGAWPDCPLELRDEYRSLQRRGFRAAEARAMLEGQAA